METIPNSGTSTAATTDVQRSNPALAGPRDAHLLTAYTAPERRFSQYVQHKLFRLLRGVDSQMRLVRHYYGPQGDQPRSAYFGPAGLKADDLRPSVAGEIVSGAFRFLVPVEPGGPVAQRSEGDRIVETQMVSTHYPHVILERRDVYDGARRARLYTEWRAVRVQNQRRETLVNRALDAANLGLELAKLLPLC